MWTFGCSVWYNCNWWVQIRERKVSQTNEQDYGNPFQGKIESKVKINCTADGKGSRTKQRGKLGNLFQGKYKES